MGSQKLNLEISKAISEFERAMKKFEVKNLLYRIVFRGSGLEFDSYRNYDTADDAVNIDWKASKKSNKLLVKQYVEERDLKIVFIVDVSERMVFGSTPKLKCEYVAEMISALSHLILTTGDSLGFLLYNEEIVQFSPPSKNMQQFHFFLNELSDGSIYKGGSNLDKVLDFALVNLDESVSTIIFISDFLGVTEKNEKVFNLLSNKFETIALMVKDPLDRALPSIDKEILIEHPVTGETILINPRISRDVYEKIVLEQELIVREIFKKRGIDLLSMTTDKYFVIPLVEFLKERARKKGWKT